jgi:hypothetical protein
MIPFYTQISGTSMATPYTAGVVALMLDADPTLTPDEIKQILTDTASKMPGYEDYEVGSGFINAYAAVDKVFNRSRAYRSIQEPTFNAVFSEVRPPQQSFHIDYDPIGFRIRLDELDDIQRRTRHQRSRHFRYRRHSRGRGYRKFGRHQSVRPVRPGVRRDEYTDSGHRHE